MGDPMSGSYPKRFAESDLFIEYALRMTKGRLRFVGLASALLLMLAIAVAMVLAMVVGDHLISKGMPRGLMALLRWLLILIEAGLAGAMIFAPLARRINDLYVARLIEKKHPEFRNDLTAALQLDGDSRVHQGPLRAIKRRAAGEVAGADVESAVTTRRVKISAIVLAVAAGLFAIYWAVSDKSVTDSLFRAMGDSSVAAPTHTRFVAVEPPTGEEVLVAKPVNFCVQVRNPRGPVVLKASRNGGRSFLKEDTFNLTETADGSGTYTGSWIAAAEDGKAAFQVSCGDALSPLHELVVLPAPTIRKIDLTLTWPAYTQRGVKTADNGHVEALPGTLVSVRAKANLPVRLASMVFEKSHGTSMEVASEDEMTGAFTVKDADRYRIEFASKHKGVEGASIWYDVKPCQDAPPQVKLSKPTDRVDAAVNDKLQIAGEFSDDFGVGEATLVCQASGQVRRFRLCAFDAPGVERRPFDQTIPVAQIGQQGQTVICYVEAKDFCPMPDGSIGQVGKSDNFIVAIKAPDEQIEAQAKAQAEAEARQKELQKENQGEPTTQLVNAQDVKDAVDKLLGKDGDAANKLDALNKLLNKADPNGEAARNVVPAKDGQNQDPNNPGQQAQNNAQQGQQAQNNQGQNAQNQNAQNGQNQGQNNQGQNGQNQGQNNQGQNGQNQNPQGQQGQGQQGQGQQGDNGQGQQGQGQQGQGQQGDNGQGQQGQGQQGQGQQGDNGQGQQGQGQQGQGQQGDNG
ncbi:MAG: DUF4175 family protein, partial [Phycisphaerae bacterium]